MPSIPIAVSYDVSVGIAYAGHFSQVPPMPFPAISPAVDVPCPMKWPPGGLTGKNKLTSTVLYNGNWTIVQDGHDCGMLIPQITLLQLNVFTPIIMMASSRSTLISCFSVRMNGEKTACTVAYVPMINCSTPVDVPFSPTVSNLTRSVHVGMSWADVIGGLVAYAASALVKKFMGDSKIAGPFIKAAAGLAASAVQHAIDPHYPYSAQVKFDVGGGEVKVGVQGGSSDTANNPTQATASYERKGADGVGSAKASGSYTQDAGGDPSKEGGDASAKVRAGADEQSAGGHVDKSGNATGTGAAAPASPSGQGAWGQKT